MVKEFNEPVVLHYGAEQSESLDAVKGAKSGTVGDIEDMKRMGKEQLFRVPFAVTTRYIEC